MVAKPQVLYLVITTLMSGTLVNCTEQGPGMEPTTATYTVVLQYGLSPYPSYLSSFSDWVEFANPTTYHGGESGITLSSGSAASDLARSLVFFSLTDLPRNMRVVGAYVQLYLGTNGIPSGTWQVGLHQAKVQWIETATWNDTGLGGAWGAGKLVPDTSPMTPGDSYVSAAMDTVSFTSSSTDGAFYAWNLDPSVVQDWVSGTLPNYGLVLVSEGEGSDSSGTMLFGSRSDGSHCPALYVTYTIP